MVVIAVVRVVVKVVVAVVVVVGVVVMVVVLLFVLAEINLVCWLLVVLWQLLTLLSCAKAVPGHNRLGSAGEAASHLGFHLTPFSGRNILGAALQPGKSVHLKRMFLTKKIAKSTRTGSA